MIFDYAKDYVADNGESLHAKYTPDSYVKNFQISDDVINGILAKAREKKVKFDEKEIDQDRHFIKEWIRAEIGYQVFGYNVNARIHLPMDKQFQKAYSLLSEAKKMSEVFK